MAVIAMGEPDDAMVRSVFTKYARVTPTKMVYWEFYRLMKQLSIHVKDIASDPSDNYMAQFCFIDSDGDGKIGYPEFKAWWSSNECLELFRGEKKTHLENAYSLYTRHARADAKGLTIHSYGRLMNELMIEANDDDFDALDKNEDGVVSFAEFCAWLKWF